MVPKGEEGILSGASSKEWEEKGAATNACAGFDIDDSTKEKEKDRATMSESEQETVRV